MLTSVFVDMNEIMVDDGVTSDRQSKASRLATTVTQEKGTFFQTFLKKQVFCFQIGQVSEVPPIPLYMTVCVTHTLL